MTTTIPAMTSDEAGALIAEPPTTFTDHDLDHELRPDPPSRWGRRITSLLLALTILGVGVLGGAWAEKRWGTAGTAGSTSGGGSLSSSLTGGFGGIGGFPDGGAPPTGAPGGGTGGPPAGG